MPWLFVHGTRDPFGTPDELRAVDGHRRRSRHAALVEGKGHDLKGADAEVAGVVTDWLRTL